MKNILVSTDFSRASRSAMVYAASLARSFGAKLHLVNVVLPPVLVDDSLIAPLIITQAEILAQNNELMQQEIEILSKTPTVRVSAFVREGNATETILQLAQEADADLIVMGMKGKGKSNSIFGSTTTTIIRKSTYPVFVIPEHTIFSSINQITLASDFGSEIEMDRYTLLKSLADKFNSKINILHVEKKHSPITQEAIIGKMDTGLTFSMHHHEFHTITENKVEEGIYKFIEQNHTDVLAMVAHKHPIFNRLFGKVHTKSMSYQTQIPLLVLQNK